MVQKKVRPISMLLLLLCLSMQMQPALADVLAPTNATDSLITRGTNDPTIVKINGSSSMSTLNQTLKQRFEQEYPGTAVDVETEGTETALKELLNNEIDLAAIGRALTSEEKAEGLKEIPISQERIAIIVGQDNPFKGSLTVEQFRQIFRGEITDWSEVGGAAGRIWLIDRPQGSDTRTVLSQYGISRDAVGSANREAADATPETAETVIRLENDDTAAVIRQLGKDGISYAIASQIAKQDRARIVKLAILHEALPDDSLYPYSQIRGYAYKESNPATVESFLGFAAGEPGQAAIATAKTAEAAAIVSALEPAPVQPSEAAAPEGETAIAPAEPKKQTRSWWLLPLLLLLPLFRWLRNRFSESTAAQPAPATAPLAESPLAVSPEVIAAVFDRGRQRYESGSYAEALPDLNQVVEANPSLAEAWIVRGKVLLKLERLEEAMTSFNHATEINPELAEAWVGKGDVLVKLGLADEATVSYQRAAALAPLSNAIEWADAVTEPVAESVTGSEETTLEIDTAIEPFAAAPEVETLDLQETEAILEPALPSAAGVSFTANEQSDLSVESFKQVFLSALARQGKSLETATPQDYFRVLADIVRDRLFQLQTPEACLNQGARLVGEFSAEFMPGLHLANNLLNLGVADGVAQAMQELGVEISEVLAQEEEPGLGRGGLGQLMVSYLDALATAEVPAIGYGIRYELGIFDQEIREGWQVEVADDWLRNGNLWEVERSELSVEVQFGGHTEAYIDSQNRYRVRWVANETIKGIPYDTAIPGYQVKTVNLLRLWKAEAIDLSQVLYPSDMELQGKQVRLKQQFFFVSCALQDIMRMHLSAEGRIETLPEGFALQLNDTDPIVAIVELMRLLIDAQGLAWEQAWDISQRCFAYTNHSLLPEALDYTYYSVSLFGELLPRHLEIILELNARFLGEVRSRYPGDEAKVQRLSLIDEAGDRYVRMVYLACLGSHAVNGVSPLHTTLFQHLITPELCDLYPEKFSNKTNGITPRRFLALSNPRLSNLITSKIGDRWITDLENLKALEAYADDPAFRSEWRQVKQATKQDLAALILQQTGIAVNVNSLFDVQAIEIHEHKRQHLNLLHIITLYNRIKANPSLDLQPRTFIFSGKAAADYDTAKLIIKLINAVAEVVNSDSQVGDRLKVVFLPDLTLHLAQQLYPATDLAESIATAGSEACDIGNMATVMNGGLVVGTPDGSNLEIRNAVEAANFFLFGLTVEEIFALKPHYNPWEVYSYTPELKQAIDQIAAGFFSKGDTDLFYPLVNLMHWDAYLLLADYAAYVACQEQISQTYRDAERWTHMTILATARMGEFSADRAVQNYCQEIWGILPGQVERAYVQA